MLPVCTSPKIAVIRQCRVVCELGGQGFCGSKVKSVLCPILRYKLPEAHKRLHVSASTLFYHDTLLRPQGSHSTRLDHRGEPEVLFSAMASDFF